MNTNKQHSKKSKKEKKKREEKSKGKKKRKTAEYCHIVVHVTNSSQTICYILS